ncbi:S9 family peptidase [Sphingomonas sp. JC676]|uniref:alpha/beta hydrolase family protein n=1 Tax=Sphingomonas sp. JC676 TaxID=2768065 RepID=UPI001657E9E6|nr:prolyl oligopeptidase family serine peptidase [Sphingomonas sp. JC676]MBC9031332.1 S9 family peptidase [Sphingomonas sp. JC676]
MILNHKTTSRFAARHAWACLLLAGAAIASPAAAQTAAPAASQSATSPSPAVLAGFPMNDEIRTKVRAMRGLAVSPDGKSVLAGITDTTAEGGLPHLWLLGPDAKPRQLTFTRSGDRGGETSAQFSPDGKSILFLATRDGARSLFRLPQSGGEPERFQITKSQKGEVAGGWGGALKKDNLVAPGGYAFSPDGKYLALWGDDPEDPAIKARKERKDDGYNHEEPEAHTFLYMVDIASGATRPVKLDGKFNDLEWSYDSVDMIVTTDPRSDLTGPDSSFWQVNPDTLAATKLDLPKTAGGVAFLPGRKRMVFTNQCLEDAPPRCNDLYVKDLATGQVKNLTPGFDGDIPENYTVLPNGDLALTISTHMRSRLATLSTTTGAVTWHDFGLPVASPVSTNGKLSAWAFIGTGPTDPSTVFLASKWGAKPVTLEAPALMPSTWAKVPSKLVTWQNEGLTIEGMLYLPPNIAPGTKIPLVMSIHGGPAGRFQDDYSAAIQMLVAEGWAVMQPNIRGSTGYGAKFLGANKNDLGGADYRDVMAGVDMLLKNYPIDESKMALIGYSYGGEMAGFVVGKTDRFKAIVSGAPVINQFSEYGTERGTFYDRWYYGRPWDHFADVWRQSPISTVMHAKTPFLLLQGEEDVTDPLGQSLEMWRALKQYGAPVALIVYPREGHGETGGSFRSLVSMEPWHGIDLRRRMFGFLRAAFAGEPDPLAIARKDVPTP